VKAPLAFLLLIAQILSFQCAIAACFPAPPGLIGWWAGDGNGNDFAGSHNALLQGGASATAPGFVGTAFSFDGTNGYAQIADAPIFHPTNLTIEAWVRFNSLDSAASGGSPAGDQYIVFKQNSRTGDFEGFDLGKTRVAGSDYFRFIVVSATDQGAYLRSATVVTNGVWYHVAAVRGPTFTQLYVNGQLERQTNANFAQDYGSLPVFLGSSGQSFWDHKFSGTLDEVSLYDRALSTNEIATLYAAGASGKCKAPVITSQPQGLVAAAGSNCLFTVTASGIVPLSYQWQLNGVDLGGATRSALTLNNIQSSDAGDYQVVVTNGAGSVTSAVAALTVWLPPTITTQPQSQTNVIGTTATFIVAGSSVPPFGYQWQFNGANIGGATGSAFSLNSVLAVDAGNYTAVLTNMAGTTTSTVAVLTVWTPPSIVAQPQSRTNVAGTAATFSVTHSGTPPFSYQWQFNGSDIAGATGSVLALSNVQPVNEGTYRVVVTNDIGSTTSAVALLTVWVTPFVTAQPQSRTNLTGTTASFSASALGTPAPGYQWQFNGGNIGGATDSTLTLTNVQPSQGGNYTCVAANGAGSATSTVAFLTVLVPPAIVAQPQNRTNAAGTAATFTVTASGTQPFSYQWQFGGTPIADATGATLTLSNVQPADAGNYAVVVTNSVGSVTSAVAVLTVWILPVITSQPQGRTNIGGTMATFNATATGTAPLSYQWRLNGLVLTNSGRIVGATSNALTITSVQGGDAGAYTLSVSNGAGVVTSAPAILTFIPNCASTPNNLIGWWAGDGNGNDLAGTHNVLLQGGATANAAGFVSAAFSFDGTNGYGQIADAPIFHPTNLTIEAWVRFNSLDSPGLGASPAGDQFIVFKQNSRTSDFEGFDLGKTRVGGIDYFRFLVVSATDQIADMRSATIVSTGVWYHVAAVRGPTFTQLYVNGQLERQTNVSFPQDYGSLPLFLGSSGQPFWDHKFSGTLDEVSLYDRALSTNEIAALYSSGASGKCKAPGILIQPQSLIGVAGSNVTIATIVTGKAPLSYQWQFNGSNFANTTSANLTIQNVQPTNAGNYNLVLTNSLGTVTSDVATLIVLVPPAIVPPPQSRTNVVGTTAIFTANASGTAPLSYQWQFNGASIGGATNTTLTLDSIQTTNAGNYALVVTNLVGSATSAVAVLTVWVPPAIVNQPQSRTNVSGTTASFSITASGTSPFSYQWQFNETNIVGATASALTLSNVQAAAAGNYRVVVTNSAAATTSLVAVLTVWTPPVITVQPASRTNVVGTTATFSPTVTGNPSPSYQWRFNGTNLTDGAVISGANSNSLVLSNVQTTNAGSYSMVVSNAVGMLTSAVAVLTIIVPPTITSQPTNTTAIAGTNVLFSVTASGTLPLTYRWQFNGADIVGATNRNLTLTNVQPAVAAGNYAVVITNVAGSITSATALLVVLTPPVFTIQPASRTNPAGSTVFFTTAAAGSLPIDFQWQFQGINLTNNSRIGGAKSTDLSITNMLPADAGPYRVVASNAAGMLTSSVAILTLALPPSIVTQPASIDVPVGTNTILAVNAPGTPPLTYRWQRNGTNLADGGNISGAGSPLLSLLSLQTNDSGNYRVIITNMAASVTSSVAVLGVKIPPRITSQPLAQIVLPGSNATFTAMVDGDSPLGYQWQKDGINLTPGSNILGVASTTLTIQNARTIDAGNYRMVVTNTVGAAASAAATLSVAAPTLQADALVLVNSSSARYLDFQRYIQPYLDNFGVPYTVFDIATNGFGTNLGSHALIIVGHRQLDTNHLYLDSSAQLNLSSVVSNGTGLVNFDSDLWAGPGAARYQFVQDIFGFGYRTSSVVGSVAFPITEPLSQMHYITARHATNESMLLSNSMSVVGLTLASNLTAITLGDTQPLVVVKKYGQGHAVQWTSYDWISTSVHGPLNGLDDVIWRGLVWAARKPFVMRGMPNFVAMRVDDVSGPFWWVHMANDVGFKPYLGLFINDVSETVVPDLRSLVTNGNATASIHSFSSSDLFFFNHQTESSYSDSVISNNFYLGIQWHQSHGIPSSKCFIPHYSEIGPNAFAWLPSLGIEYIAIEVVPGTVEYGTPPAPWLVGGPYRLYEPPQPGEINLPLYYADFLSVPGHPEMNGQFFNRYTEIRDTVAPGQSDCGEWCPDNNVQGSIDRGTRQLKRALDSQILASLFTHEWFIHPTPCCGGTTITSNNWRAILQGITNNLAAYQPIYVTTDYADQYVRATRTSRITASQIDASSGQLFVSLTGKTDLATSVQVFLGNDNLISTLAVNVPAFLDSVTIVASTIAVPPVILVPPRGQTNLPGATATFTTIAGGTPPLTYQWLRNNLALTNGGNISGASSSALICSNIAQADAGSYSVAVSNSIGSVSSAGVPLTVVIPPQVNSISLLADRNISMTFSGSSNITYQIDASTNLVQWMDLTNLSSPNGIMQFIDMDATNFARRFYRPTWLP
jgi:hypothetical protein